MMAQALCVLVYVCVNYFVCKPYVILEQLLTSQNANSCERILALLCLHLSGVTFVWSICLHFLLSS